MKTFRDLDEVFANKTRGLPKLPHACARTYKSARIKLSRKEANSRKVSPAKVSRYTVIQKVVGIQMKFIAADFLHIKVVESDVLHHSCWQEFL